MVFKQCKLSDAPKSDWIFEDTEAFTQTNTFLQFQIRDHPHHSSEYTRRKDKTTQNPPYSKALLPKKRRWRTFHNFPHAHFSKILEFQINQTYFQNAPGVSTILSFWIFCKAQHRCCGHSFLSYTTMPPLIFKLFGGGGNTLYVPSFSLPFFFCQNALSLMRRHARKNQPLP